MQTIHVSYDQLPPDDTGLPAVAAAPGRPRPDAWLTARLPMGAARCALWWRDTPQLPGKQIGLLGCYTATHEQAAAALLAAATDRLKAEGCSLALGPMDGTTWQPYRLVVEGNAEPPFFMEPAHPAAYLAHFTAVGFAPCAYYNSTYTPDLRSYLSQRPPLAPRLSALAEADLHLRTATPEELHGDAGFVHLLETIYPLAIEAFAANPFYSPTAVDAFVAQYLPLRSLLQAELLLLIEQAGAPVGFLFAMSDLAQRGRGERCDRVILKTVALAANQRRHGLATLLADYACAQAATLGYRQAIFALMHETNPSQRIGAGAMQPLRRYALFAKLL